MFKKGKEKELKGLIKDFFDKTTFPVEIEIGEEEGATIPVLITMEEPRILIGEGGKTLLCLQTLLSKILKRKLQKDLYLDLDINNYKKKKIAYLKDIARAGADEVALSKQEKELAPMPAYERRLIHLELKERSDVLTESRGQEPYRNVVIKPA